MERKTCFYKCVVAFVVMICSTITMSAQTKVTSANQLKAGCVIKIYPYSDYYGDKDYALACSGDGQPLDIYKNVGSGDEWTLEDAGDGSCYVKNNNGCYWAYQGSSDDEEMKCTIDKSSAVKVRLTWDSKNGGVCFWNDIDGSGLIDYDGWFYWWAYPDEDYPYNEVTFDIALLKEGSGSDFVQKEMTTVVDGIKYSLDANQKTAKVIANNHSYSGDIDIPANITYDNVVYKVNALGLGCFADCEGLKSIKLPDGITSIGGRCFYNCENLQSVDLPSGITSLGDDCFYGCSSLKSISLPDGITSLEEGCFSGCSDLIEIKLPSNIRSFGESCFYGCSSLKSISLPDGITSLGECCFVDYSSLTSVDLPSSITSLGDNVFNGCYNLKSICLPDGLTSIGDKCFYRCENLESIKLPLGINSLGKGCFWHCSSLSSISLPQKLTSLGTGCFRGCSSLTNIDLSCITSLGALVLADCSKLKNVKLPSGITSLGAYFFDGCSSLESIDLPSGLNSLGYCCFRDCSSLTNIYLPLGLTTLGGNSTPEDTDMGSGPVHETESDRFLHGCFSGCSSLTSINLPSGITSLGGDCFSGCRSLTNINLPSGITSLGDNCFFGCRSLTSIKLPSGITSLGDRCFRDCSSLTNVSLPSGINSLGEYCFLGCKGLASIYMYAEKLPTMGNMVFENCDADNCTLYVPKGTIDMYRQSDFGYFKNIVELDATGINNPAASTNLKEVYRYTTNGRRLLTPTKGINVVKYSNGMVKKELVK